MLYKVTSISYIEDHIILDVETADSSYSRSINVQITSAILDMPYIAFQDGDHVIFFRNCSETNRVEDFSLSFTTMTDKPAYMIISGVLP